MATTGRGRRRSKGAHARRRDRRFSSALFWGLLAAILAGSGSLAVATWGVGLTGGSSGQSQSAGAPADLTISATASPSPTNELYPGGTGDVLATITNTNTYPVTVTGLDLPADTSYATGYTNSSLTTPNASCSASSSLVTYAGSTGTSGAAVTLATPLVVAANASLTVTFTNDATMGASAPAACESTWFSMPSFTGVIAGTSGGSPTSSPATDSWP